MKLLQDINCIIFGNGFIGTNLCMALAGKVARLKIFGRRPFYINLPPEVEYIPGDFTDSSAVASALSGCNVVIHLIGGSTPASSNIDKIADVQANIIATLKLLELCKIEKIDRIIFASSGGAVYGISSIFPIAEEAQTNPICAYGISKLALEKYLALFEYLDKIEHRVLRIANPYGPFQRTIRNQGVISIFLKNILQGKAINVWGDGSVIRDYIYIDDVTQAFIRAIVHQGSSRVFNIGSGKGLSLQEIILAMETITGYQCQRNQLPARSLDVPVSILDITKARQELNWQPTVDILEGLQKTIVSMKQYNL